VGEQKDPLTEEAESEVIRLDFAQIIGTVPMTTLNSFYFG
jgi:hypothetical protein